MHDALATQQGIKREIEKDRLDAGCLIIAQPARPPTPLMVGSGNRHSCKQSSALYTFMPRRSACMFTTQPQQFMHLGRVCAAHAPHIYGTAQHPFVCGCVAHNQYYTCMLISISHTNVCTIANMHGCMDHLNDAKKEKPVLHSTAVLEYSINTHITCTIPRDRPTQTHTSHITFLHPQLVLAYFYFTRVRSLRTHLVNISP